jgi:hypothetical protein
MFAAFAGEIDGNKKFPALRRDGEDGVFVAGDSSDSTLVKESFQSQVFFTAAHVLQ